MAWRILRLGWNLGHHVWKIAFKNGFQHDKNRSWRFYFQVPGLVRVDSWIVMFYLRKTNYIPKYIYNSHLFETLNWSPDPAPAMKYCKAKKHLAYPCQKESQCSRAMQTSWPAKQTTSWWKNTVYKGFNKKTGYTSRGCNISRERSWIWEDSPYQWSPA